MSASKRCAQYSLVSSRWEYRRVIRDTRDTLFTGQRLMYGPVFVTLTSKLEALSSVTRCHWLTGRDVDRGRPISTPRSDLCQALAAKTRS